MALLTHTTPSQKSLTASRGFLSKLEVEKAGDDRILLGNMRTATNRMRLVKVLQLSEFSVPNKYSILTENAQNPENLKYYKLEQSTPTSVALLPQ
jgi:hypothetical protein